MNIQSTASNESQRILQTPGVTQRRVVHLPYYDDNPYQSMVMEAQRALGWDAIEGGGGGNFFRTAIRHWKPSILHLHWLHPYLLRESVLKSWMRGLRFLAEIAVIRRRGIKVAWTVHNLSNHDQKYAEVELKLSRQFSRMCDLVVTHGQKAAVAAREHFGVPTSTPVLVVRHPNYCQDDFTPRAPQGKAEGCTVGFLGRVERYKQVTKLVEAFREVAGEKDQLQIGGHASDDGYAKQIVQSIADDPRISFENRYVADQEIAGFLREVHVMACPSSNVLTSGSVILAMSHGLPVIAPDEGCTAEEVGTAGFVYDPTGEEGLRLALRDAMSDPVRLASLGLAARKRAEEASPSRVAQEIIQGYEAILAL